MLSLISISSFQLLKLQVCSIRGQKEAQITHHHAVPHVFKSLASLPSLHLSGSPYVCFVYNVQGFLDILSRRNREKYTYYTFLWKWKNRNQLLVLLNEKECCYQEIPKDNKIKFRKLKILY